MRRNARTKESIAQGPQGELVGLADDPLFLTCVTLGDVFPVRAFYANKPRGRRSLSPIMLPLCDLRDLCAMLSPIRAFPAHQLPLKASLTYELNQSRK